MTSAGAVVCNCPYPAATLVTGAAVLTSAVTVSWPTVAGTLVTVLSAVAGGVAAAGLKMLASDPRMLVGVVAATGVAGLITVAGATGTAGFEKIEYSAYIRTAPDPMYMTVLAEFDSAIVAFFIVVQDYPNIVSPVEGSVLDGAYPAGAGADAWCTTSLTMDGSTRYSPCRPPLATLMISMPSMLTPESV